MGCLPPLPAYALVSPVRDEAEHIARTIGSVADQRHRPVQWVIVDDGSTDDTKAIAERFAREHPWITVVDSGQVHDRARGAPIVRAFNHGVAHLRAPHDVLVKLDGDLYLPPQYFEWVARVFADDRLAGVVSGTVLVFDGRRWRPDHARGQERMTNGVAKAYRVACLDDIGGLRASMGWDGLDDYGARARGWHVHVLHELPILHFKPRGSKQPWLRARWEEGCGAHYMGYGMPFLLVRAAYRVVRESPPLVGGLVLAGAYVWSRLLGRPQVDDPLARKLLQADQRARLLGGLGRSAPETPPPAHGGPAFTATRPDVAI